MKKRTGIVIGVMWIWIYGLVGCMGLNTLPIQTALALIGLALAGICLIFFVVGRR